MVVFFKPRVPKNIIDVMLNRKSESSARLSIHMKNQALFFSKDKSKKKIQCRLLQFLFGALRIKIIFIMRRTTYFSYANSVDPAQRPPCS